MRARRPRLDAAIPRSRRQRGDRHRQGPGGRVPARRRGRAQHGGPVRRPGLRRGPHEHRHQATRARRRRARDRPRRVLRAPSRARSAGAVLVGAHAGRGACLRLARSHPVAFRRAGLHGERNAGRQEYAGRLARPFPSGTSVRDVAVPRGGDRPGAAARAARRAGRARDVVDRALRHPRRPGHRRAPGLRNAVRRERETRPSPGTDGARSRPRDRQGDVRCAPDVAGRGRFANRAGERRHVSIGPLRPGDASDRAAHPREHRCRDRVRRDGRLGHARRAGRRARSAGRASR